MPHGLESGSTLTAPTDPAKPIKEFCRVFFDSSWGMCFITVQNVQSLDGFLRDNKQDRVFDSTGERLQIIGDGGRKIAPTLFLG